ncbi:general secretion pathway protein M [Methylomagnum ishizawai]|uniref:General secretion pathway protein M n=1 Tax=Methylomagnum ishizawai TaxID=1760988 RepID=A0A1Y6D855_9GAMM|nr:type II secretion system protein GspM [Methylomagnum ishizawai]SMF96953.1 general secretion pathway protein M [Methylomagnum ishizawai]
MNLNQPIRINKSRLAALGLLFGVLAVVYFACLAPLLGLAREYGENIEELQFRLTRLSKIAAEKEGLVKRLEVIRAEGEQDDSFLARSTAALASAELQTQIKGAVSEAGGELTSTQVIPEHIEENFTRVAVKVRMNGGTNVLRQVLHNFESAKPSLFIENLNIRPIRVPRNPMAKGPQTLPDKLSVDFDVVGYMRTQ